MDREEECKSKAMTSSSTASLRNPATKEAVGEQSDSTEKFEPMKAGRLFYNIWAMLEPMNLVGNWFISGAGDSNEKFWPAYNGAINNDNR